MYSTLNIHVSCHSFGGMARPIGQGALPQSMSVQLREAFPPCQRPRASQYSARKRQHLGQRRWIRYLAEKGTTCGMTTIGMSVARILERVARNTSRDNDDVT